VKKTLLKDIAKEVGVSISLVSYVLNDQAVEKKVNKETAQRIRVAALDLNYRPNQIAKSLKTNKTLTIGLIVADINYRFTTGITRAIEAEAKKNNYTVIFGSSDEKRDKFADLVSALVNRQVDGLILVPVENSQPQIESLQRMNIPFVLLDRYFSGIKANIIALDNYKAAYESTEYMIKKGRKRIAFVNYKTSLEHLLERNRGYINALKDNGLEYDKNLLLEVRYQFLKKDIEAGINKVMNFNPVCDGIFFATDILTINGLKYFNHTNFKVPQDVSILSFDESESFELFYCPITYSKQPLEQMGKLAVNTLIDLIGNNKVQNQFYLNSQLIIGKSCGE
jgi:LacI family transcriptional regulator